LSLPDDCPSEVQLSDIRYTLDGSEPVDTSCMYNDVISISTTKVVRAKIIKEGYLRRRSVVNTYIIENRSFTLPVVSISLDSAFLWDDEFGIYIIGNGVNGIIKNGTSYKANFNNDWRRPMNFEYFADPNGEAVLNQLGEMRIAGNYSRVKAQKSLILYSHKRFGDEKRFN